MKVLAHMDRVFRGTWGLEEGVAGYASGNFMAPPDINSSRIR